MLTSGGVRERRSARAVIAAVALAATVAATGCDLVIEGPGGADARAERRVRAMLDGLESGQTRGARESDLSAAEAQWWNGRNQIMDPPMQSRVSNLFRRWREQKGLTYGGLGDSEIVAVEAPADDGDPVVVAVLIDGRPLRIEVPEDEPIRWAR